jgi:hypothetical protein
MTSIRYRPLPIGLAIAISFAACRGDGAPPTSLSPDQETTTSRAATTATTTTVPGETTTTTTLPFTPPFLIDPYYDYEAVLSIPADAAGIPYRDPGLSDFLPTGPTAMTVGDDGVIYLADPIGGRIIGFDPSTDDRSEIDLAALAIGPILALDGDESGLMALEVDVSPSPPVYRAHRIDGSTILSYPLGAGLRLETGLSGARLDDGGGIVVELEGGAALFSVGLDGTTPIGALHEGNREFVLGDREIIVDGTTVRPPMRGDLGGVRLLAARPDGSWYLVQDDVISTSPIEVEVWVRYYGPDDQLVASARVPIEERYYVPEQELAVGPDGEVYYLLPRSDVIDVVVLGFTSGSG